MTTKWKVEKTEEEENEVQGICAHNKNVFGGEWHVFFSQTLRHPVCAVSHTHQQAT